MQSSQKKSFKKITKYILAGALTFGLTQVSASVMAQSGPPSPPPPDQVFKRAGSDLKRINPFKKGRKAPSGPQAGPPAPGGAPAGGPPPPPNPFNIFKKKGGTPPAPPKPPGA